jgi:hypothetical protein
VLFRSEPWNGRDFYVSFGEDRQRTWDDARQNGFISAGGGRWYSHTLAMLFPGARVFVCIPKRGYVGVGLVKETVVPITEFKVRVNNVEMPILDAPLQAPAMGEAAENPDLREYLVRVEWLKTLSPDQAIWEKGMFANQNSVCKLRNKFTLARLTAAFQLED